MIAAIVIKATEIKKPMNPTTVRIVFDVIHNEGLVPENKKSCDLSVNKNNYCRENITNISSHMVP